MTESTALIRDAIQTAPHVLPAPIATLCTAVLKTGAHWDVDVLALAEAVLEMRQPAADRSPLGVLTRRDTSQNPAAAREQYRARSPRFLDPVDTAERARQDALDLAALVREEDPAVVVGALVGYDRAQLAALAVVLAAYVPVDREESELLAWLPEARAVAS